MSNGSHAPPLSADHDLPAHRPVSCAWTPGPPRNAPQTPSPPSASPSCPRGPTATDPSTSATTIPPHPGQAELRRPCENGLSNVLPCKGCSPRPCGGRQALFTPFADPSIFEEGNGRCATVQSRTACIFPTSPQPPGQQETAQHHWAAGAAYYADNATPALRPPGLVTGAPPAAPGAGEGERARAPQSHHAVLVLRRRLPSARAHPRRWPPFRREVFRRWTLMKTGAAAHRRQPGRGERHHRYPRRTLPQRHAGPRQAGRSVLLQLVRPAGRAREHDRPRLPAGQQELQPLGFVGDG